MFGALLDKDKGGHCTVRPTHETYATKQLYLPDTAILVTRFMTEAGAGEVVDFIPVTGTAVTPRHRLVRMIRCVRGSMTFDVEIAPRFNYGRTGHKLHITENGAVFAAKDGTELSVHPTREPEDERLVDVLMDRQDDLHFSLTLQAGQQRGLILESAADGPPRQFNLADSSATQAPGTYDGTPGGFVLRRPVEGSLGAARRQPSRSTRWSPTRRAFAMAVRDGLTAPMLGKKLVSTTYGLSRSSHRVRG